MFKERIGLIPRYNWDYGFSDFVRASAAALKPRPDKHDGLQKVFGYKPVYTSSGRASLYVILKSLNLEKGSEIGVPLFCCPVVFEAIVQAGLVPRFIDITLEDYGLSSEDLEMKVGSLSAVVAVHMFGHAVDMDSISSVSGAMPIIEDCAQSLFSKYNGQYTGFLSEVSFFSFRSGKYISAGEGSAIFARDRSLDEAIRNRVNTLKEPSFSQEILHPMSTYIKSTLYKRPWYGTIGLPVGTRIDHKLNLTSKTGFSSGKIAKTDLRIINERIETFFQRVQRQKENSLYLLENLKMKDVVLLQEKEECWSNYYQFVIRFEHQKQRDAIADFLFDRGIDTAKYLDEVVGVATENYNYSGDCPNAEQCSKTVLVIPNHYTLSKRDLDYIVNCVNEGCERWKV